MAVRKFPEILQSFRLLAHGLPQLVCGHFGVSSYQEGSAPQIYTHVIVDPYGLVWFNA